MKLAHLLIFPLLLFLSAIAGAQVEPFSLRDLDGQLVNAAEFIGKKPVLIDFWATWCKPCVKSLPKLQELHERYGDNGLIILGINEDGSRSLAKVEPMARSLGLTFRVLIDESGDIMRKYQVSGLPTTFLIDSSGNIVLTLRGYRPADEQTLKMEIEKLLQSPAL